MGVALMVVAGCSHLNLTDEQRQANWQAHQQAVSVLESWDIVGRAAVAMKGRVYNLGLQWRQRPDSMQMLLQAPFGQGVIRIETIANGQFQLRLPKGQTFVNDSPEALLNQVVGWSIPLSGLKFWIRGLPQAEFDYQHHLNSNGFPSMIRQNQWRIDYQSYFADLQPALPRRIKLTHQDQDLELKLVVERWQRDKIEVDPNTLFPEFD